MGKLAIVLAALMLAGGLAASNLARTELGDTFRQARQQHSPVLFEPAGDAETSEVAFRAPDSRMGLQKAQLIDDSGPRSEDQMFGAGTALGFHSEALGLGVSAWFDFYLAPFIAISTRFHIAYGIVTRTHKDGGEALNLGLSLGAKFVFDFPDAEISRWLRPWVALYPAGFAYISATEKFDPPDSGDDKRFRYSDIYYLIQAGTGVDFFLTSMIGLGAGVYITGTVGGSKHVQDDVTIRTRGQVGVYFEYARLSLRF